MRIGLFTGGSRGDVQPLVTFARRLVRAAHRVRLATHSGFEDLFQGAELEFFPVEGDPKGILEDELRTHQNENWGARVLRYWRRSGPHPGVLERLVEACADLDLVIYTSTAAITAHAAESAGIPSMPLLFYPASPTAAFPSPFTPSRPGFQLLPNRLTHIGIERFSWSAERKWVDPWRRSLGLAPLDSTAPWQRMRRNRQPMLFAFSDHVVAKPHDWYEEQQVTGFFFEEPERLEPLGQRLSDFLRAGPAPVVVTFGSTLDADAVGLSSMVRAAIDRLDVRAVIIQAWTGLETGESTRVLNVPSAPFARLFPSAAAVVHHGGTGTFAEAIRAGVPSVVIPFYGEQRFWARVAADTGVAPKPIPRLRLTADALAAAISRALNDATMRRESERLGAVVRTEDGTGTAVEYVERYFGSTPLRSRP